MRSIQVIFLVLGVFFSSCTSQKKPTADKQTAEQELFTVLTAEQTGLNFNNKLEETIYMNGFYYEYFYNGGGVAVADFNNDGLEDIYFTSNLRTNKLYLNRGGLKFKNVSVRANAQGRGGFPTGVTVVDINNDGFKDLYILKSGRFYEDEPLRNELLINKGVDADGVPIFEERAKDYGLDLPHFSTQATFFDYDRDGDLDMFLINHNIEVYEIDNVEAVMKERSDKIGEKLYRNDNGTFTNVTDEAGITSTNLGFTLGIAIGDVNNDGWPDVYTSNDYYEKDHLYINNQDGTFREESQAAFGHQSTFSMGNDIADINNDGLLDIISLDMMASDNYTQKASMSGMNVADFYHIEKIGLHRQYMYNALQLNNGNEPVSNAPVFSDIAQLSGVSSTDWSWAPLLFDMDNDGYRDLFVTNGIRRDFRNNDFLIYLEKKYREGVRKSKVDLAKHIDDLLEKLPDRKKENCLFLNNQDLSFNKMTIAQPLSYSNGAAYADFDQDGDLDLVVNNVDDFAYLYRNNSEKKSFVTVKLKGEGENIDALGARVEIVTGKDHFIAEQYFTRGFQSAMAVPMHFGLGNATKIDSIKVLWPNGQTQTLVDIGVNQKLVIEYDPSKSDVPQMADQFQKFTDITADVGLQHNHQENDYNDFSKESLMPHKMSQFGPAMSVADVDGDGLEDIYIGGAMRQSGALFFQSASGNFVQRKIEAFEQDSFHEDTGALFLDADNDGDQDLYVVSGGNEKVAGHSFYRDRFYVNEGNGNFIRSEFIIPDILESGQVVRAGDYDNDGDLDLFIGTRHKPMAYGYNSKSYLLENKLNGGTLSFEDATGKVIPDMVAHGMVTDALWVDLDADKHLELILTHEWGSVEVYKKIGNQFENISAKLGLNKEIGWWFSLAVDDIDHDGDLDIMAGNLGLNYKYKASNDEPFHLYLNDFDKNMELDIVLGYHQDDELFPLRGRECTSGQMPFVKQKFETYDAFARANLQDVYGTALDSSIHIAANNFATGIFRNLGNNTFDFEPMPNEIQVSSVNKILISDMNNDRRKDIMLFGNLYGSEVETPRNDASYGHYLVGTENRGFKHMSATTSGLFVNGDVRSASFINLGKTRKKGVLITRNNASIRLLQIND